MTVQKGTFYFKASLREFHLATKLFYVGLYFGARDILTLDTKTGVTVAALLRRMDYYTYRGRTHVRYDRYRYVWQKISKTPYRIPA